MYFRIEMLKAGNGDSFWIECGVDRQSAKRVVIDGGNDKEVIIERLKKLRLAGQRINLWIVTHTDDDHIKGLLALKNYGDVDEVWFNAPPNRYDEVLSYRQGDQLAQILRNRADVTTWKTYDRAENAGFPEYPLPNDLGVLKILGPKPEALERLFADWNTDTLGEADEPEENADRRPLTQETVSELSESPDKSPDTGVANAACIIVLLEIKEGNGSRRYLFPGDAPPGVVIDAIQPLKGQDNRVKLDGFKLSHHASDRSVSKSLLNLLDCRHFYISTNGKRHRLPNDAAIAKTIHLAEANTLFFNYEKVGSRWADYALQVGGIKVNTPTKGADHIVIAFQDSAPNNSGFWKDHVARTTLPPWTGLVIKVDPAGERLKVSFREKDGVDFCEPWEASETKDRVLKASKHIREILASLAHEWPPRDRYIEELTKVATSGRVIYDGLFEASGPPGSSEFARKCLEEAPAKTKIVFKCPEIEIPVPFLYSSPDPIDTKAFWALRYSVSTPFEIWQAPTSPIKLHLSTYVGVDGYESVYEADSGTHHDDWPSFQAKWSRENNCLTHFFCHNQDRTLSSKDDKFSLTWIEMSYMARQRVRANKGPDLLFINACNTHDLMQEGDWRDVLSRMVFGGFLGTEAQINKTAAQVFARIFFDCLTDKNAEASVDEAFEQARHQTWPAGLFYSMYMHPEVTSKMFFNRAVSSAQASK